MVAGRLLTDLFLLAFVIGRRCNDRGLGRSGRALARFSSRSWRAAACGPRDCLICANAATRMPTAAGGARAREYLAYLIHVSGRWPGRRTAWPCRDGPRLARRLPNRPSGLRARAHRESLEATSSKGTSTDKSTYTAARGQGRGREPWEGGETEVEKYRYVDPGVAFLSVSLARDSRLPGTPANEGAGWVCPTSPARLVTFGRYEPGPLRPQPGRPGIPTSPGQGIRTWADGMGWSVANPCVRLQRFVRTGRGPSSSSASRPMPSLVPTYLHVFLDADLWPDPSDRACQPATATYIGSSATRQSMRQGPRAANSQGRAGGSRAIALRGRASGPFAQPKNSPGRGGCALLCCGAGGIACLGAHVPHDAAGSPGGGEASII